MSKEFTQRQRLEALVALQANGWDFTKTAIQFDIADSTLHRWFEDNPEFRNQINKTDMLILDKLSIDVADKALEKRSDFIDEVYNTKSATVKRIKDIIPTSENIRDLSGLLKILHEITDGVKIKTPLDQGKGDFFQFINNQLINVKDSKNGKKE